MLLSEKNIYFSVYGLLSLPFLIFITTHLKVPFAIISSVFFLFSFAFFLKQIQQEKKDTFQISGKFLLLIILISVLFIWFSGIGGYFPQKLDHTWRNAVFHDLIMKEWPVIYQNSEPINLVYYYNYWLVPAAIAKIFIPFGEKIALEVGFFLLFLWSVLWLSEVLLLICCKFKTFSLKAAITVAIIFLGFSGLDSIGWIFRSIREWDFYLPAHLEWWCYSHQYSSHFTQLAWVFNQAVPAWLCTILLFRESNVWNSIAAFAFCFVFAPFPAVGFAGIVFCIFVCKSIYLIYKKSLRTIFIRNSVIANTMILLSVVPVLCFFYMANSKSFSTDQEFPVYFLIRNYRVFVFYILFVVLEFGCYAALLFFSNKRNILLYIISAELLIFPLFEVISNDFCMRTSIPALCILSLFIIKFFLHEAEKEANSQRRILLTILLIIGMITPLVEIVESASRCPYRDWRIYTIYTFDRPDADQLPCYQNFLRIHADETFFFKYLAKKPENYAEGNSP